MIKTIVKKKLNLTSPEFTCDGDLAPHLKNIEMLSHLNGYYFSGIIGRPGSGKTSLLISLLTGKKKEDKVFRKVFDHILVVMPTCSRESMKHNIFQHHDKDKMYNSLTHASLNDIYEKLQASTAEKESTLLILDDVGASLKIPEVQKLLREIIYNRRHLKVHIIILLQSFMSCPKEVRSMMSNIIIFKPSKNEFEHLSNEVLQMDHHEALELMNYAFISKHDYLFINESTKKIYKNFDEIIIPEK
jgi:KaiC/GvpD/RAD55 family RecA-like ATPase